MKLPVFYVFATVVTATGAQQADSWGWQTAEQTIADNMNHSADPCDDFYNFVCGNYKVNHSTSYEVDYIDIMATRTWNIVGEAFALMAPDDQSQPSSYRKAKLTFDICMGDKPNFDVDAEISGVRALLQGLGGWPTIDDDWTGYKGGAAGLLGAQLGRFGLTSGLVEQAVVPDVWLQNNSRYALFLAPMQYTTSCADADNCSLVLPPRQQIVSYVEAVAKRLSPDVDPSTLTHDANDIADIVTSGMQASFAALGHQPYPSDAVTVLRQWYHPYTVSSAVQRWPDVNWPQFLLNLANNNTDLLNAFGYPFIVGSPAYLDFIDQLFRLKSPRQLQNYLIFSLAAWEAQYLPSLRDLYLAYDPLAPKVQPPTVASHCASVISALFPNVCGRIFVQHSNMSRHDVDELSTMVGVTLNAWHGMITETPWMDDVSRQAAFDKIGEVARKVGFPDWIFNDEALDASVARLQLSQGDDGLYMLNQVQQFAVYKQMQLVGAAVDRYAWTGSPATINAWLEKYKPTMNSITFTAAIMQSPYFDHRFPKSFNYAHIGVVMGHELGHGFDTNGIYWGPLGELVPNSWITPQALAGYNSMAACLVNEYSQFCYPQLHDLCVNGSATITENIADNGGVNAAYRSYKALVGLMGGELPYSGPLAGYDVDQRFFLAYANVWCSNLSDREIVQSLLYDVHSPPQYRVTGVLVNMPEFANAFGCAAGSAMAPCQHCSVWVKPH